MKPTLQGSKQPNDFLVATCIHIFVMELIETNLRLCVGEAPGGSTQGGHGVVPSPTYHSFGGKTICVVPDSVCCVGTGPAGSLYASQRTGACLSFTCYTPIAYYEATSQNNSSSSNSTKSEHIQLLHARHYPTHLHLASQQSYKIGTTVNPMLPMRQVRHKEYQGLAQGKPHCK